MAWDQLEGNWREFKGKVKEQWGKLTNDDLDRIEGKRDQLVGILQQKYGKARDEVEKEIRDFENRMKDHLVDRDRNASLSGTGGSVGSVGSSRSGSEAGTGGRTATESGVGMSAADRQGTPRNRDDDPDMARGDRTDSRGFGAREDDRGRGTESEESYGRDTSGDEEDRG